MSARVRVGYAAAAGFLAACLCLPLAGCERREAGSGPRWRDDCVPLTRPLGLGREAARQAYRDEARRHEIRLREAAAPGSFLRAVNAALDGERIAAGQTCPAELAQIGELVFEHEFSFADGLGGGNAPRAPGGPFRRVHQGLFGGPETLSCPSCHWIGGPNGAGAETDDAFLAGDGARPMSGDARNAPALAGLGVVEALAREMTRDLQRQRADLLRQATNAGGGEREIRLTSKGVDFGVLRAGARGDIDASGVRGVDPDLVIKPFGWKGTHAEVADFAREALQVHMGIQSDALLAVAPPDVVGTGGDPRDPDGDGISGELRQGPFAALLVHLALLEMPVVQPLIQSRVLPTAAPGLRPPSTISFADDFARGRRDFHEIGCDECHRPMLVLESPVVTMGDLPAIDLSREMRQPGLRYDPDLGGYPVWLFSDLKRHDMGEANVAQHVQRGVPPRDYLTPRLWGVADSAPYLHDGRAPSFDYAVAGHDGEGAAARDAFASLTFERKSAVRVYLMSLRRASRIIVP